MEINKEKQKEAQKRARALLEEQETARAERRLSKLILDLEQGNDCVLLNNEFLGNLPGIVLEMYQAGNCDQVKLLLEKLGECTCSEKPNVRERAVTALCLCSQRILQEDLCDLTEEVTRILVRWLRLETTFLSACNVVCRQLQENGTRMFQEGRWKECDHLLETFCQIQSGRLEKSNAIRSVVSRAQEGMAADYVLEELTLVCLRGRGERRKNAEKILTHFGRRAAIHLLETLLSCNEKKDRLRLIRLIPAVGYVAAPVLKDYLKKDLPWYGIRNIILMITAMNDPELVPHIMPFLEHEDIRVQQQVIECIHEAAGENRKKYLLAALPLVNDELKGQLIVQLGQLGGTDTSEVFLDLLVERDSFAPHVRDELLKKIIINLRLSDSIRAINLLSMLIEERKDIYDVNSDLVVKSARETLQILKPRLGQGTGEEEIEDGGEIEEISEIEGVEEIIGVEALELVEEEVEENVSFANDPVTRDLAKRNLQRENEEISALLGNGDVSGASQRLYEKSIEAAKKKDFDTAEMLRDRILEVDPNALTEVIRVGELIEAERSSAISSHHLTIWQDLYDALATEEFNGLYHILQEKSYAPEDVIVEQGMAKSCLYFINSGLVTLSCQRGGDEIFLKKIGPGEIVGAAPFFDVSVWTVSLTALSKTEVHILERTKFLEMLEEFPSLESCLHKYCLRLDTVPELLKMSGEDRRQTARYPVSGVGKHALLDEYGNPGVRSFKGELADISTGGFSVYIHISRKENARLLLGKGIKSIIPIDKGQVVHCSGQIVAVRSQPYVGTDYSVHVQLKEALEEDVIKRIVSMQKQKS